MRTNANTDNPEKINLLQAFVNYFISIGITDLNDQIFDDVSIFVTGTEEFGELEQVMGRYDYERGKIRMQSPEVQSRLNAEANEIWQEHNERIVFMRNLNKNNNDVTEELKKLVISLGAYPEGGIKNEIPVLRTAVEQGNWKFVGQYINDNPLDTNNTECVNAYSDIYLKAIRFEYGDVKRALENAGVKKDLEVIAFLTSKEFNALETYLVNTKVYDSYSEDATRGWQKINKYDVLNTFVTRLKTCGTMDEVRKVYEALEAANDKNALSVSDYDLLNTARGWGYRLFGWNTTTISRINDLRAQVPVKKTLKK